MRAVNESKPYQVQKSRLWLELESFRFFLFPHLKHWFCNTLRKTARAKGRSTSLLARYLVLSTCEFASVVQHWLRVLAITFSGSCVPPSPRWVKGAIETSPPEPAFQHLITLSDNTCSIFERSRLKPGCHRSKQFSFLMS